jgi:hypothetical protein
MCLGNRRQKVERSFQKENDDVWEHYREYIDVGGKDLGMEGTRRGGESARKIFQRGARNGQKNARLHSDGRVYEE